MRLQMKVKVRSSPAFIENKFVLDETDDNEVEIEEPTEEPPTGCEADTGSSAVNPGPTSVAQANLSNGPGEKILIKSCH